MLKFNLILALENWYDLFIFRVSFIHSEVESEGKDFVQVVFPIVRLNRTRHYVFWGRGNKKLSNDTVPTD